MAGGRDFQWDASATEAFLDAIISVETDGRWNAVGGAGERGGFQFSQRTWEEFARGVPFWFAHDPHLSREVARRALATIQRRLRYHGMAIDPWHCAAAWNSGVAAVARQRLGRAQRGYAQRVLNLTLLNLRSPDTMVAQNRTPPAVSPTPAPAIEFAIAALIPVPASSASTPVRETVVASVQSAEALPTITLDLNAER